MKLLQAIAATAILTLAVQPIRAEKAMFSYSDVDEEPAMWGTQGKEYYDVAMHIVQPGLVGLKITGVTVPMFAHEDVTDISVWLSSKLEVENKRHVADIAEVAATIADDKIDIDFPEGYEIPAEGIYVGYSFKVNSTGVQATSKPIALTYGTNPESFYLHTQYNYLKWTDKSSELGGMTMIAVKLEGDIPGVAGRIVYPNELNFDCSAESFTIPMSFQSFGSDKVKSVRLSMRNGTSTTVTTYEFDAARQLMLGREYPIEVTFPNKLPKGMSYPSITVESINGESNPMVDESAPQIGLYNYSEHPRKHPLFEEYTGLWCGWCPRGFVGLERMAEEYPDFVGVAVHNDDEMTIISSKQYPNTVVGLPCGWMDRSIKLSPSYYNMKDLYEEYTNAFTPVEIVAAADYNKDAKEITFTAESSFLRPTNHELRTFCYLLGNGLTDDKWMQKNYFYDKSIEDYPDMGAFIEAGTQYISGLVYNDVMIMADFGEAGNFPYGEDLQPETPVKSEYRFNLAEAMSSTSENLNLAEKATGFSVVFGILDVENNEVLNAVKINGLNKSAVESVEADNSEAVRTEYVDLFGRQADENATGLVVRRVVYADGTVKTQKIMK